MEFWERMKDISSGKTPQERTEYVTKEPFDIVKYESLKTPEEKNAYAGRTKSAPSIRDTHNPEPKGIDVEGLIKTPVADSIYSENNLDASAPQQVQPQAPAQQPEPEMPKQEGFDPMNLLPYLAPLAVEGIMGGLAGEPTFGVSLGVSGKAIQDDLKREQDRKAKLEDMFLKAQMKRSTASEKGQRRFSSQTMIDPATKQPILITFDTFTGDRYLPDGTKISGDKIEPGFSVSHYENDRRLGLKEQKTIREGERFGRGKVIDPTTGEVGLIRNGQIIPVSKSQGLNPKQQKDISSYGAKFTSSKPFKDTIDALNTTKNVDQLLFEARYNQNSPAGENAKAALARMAEGGSRLSDQDIVRYGGTKQIKETAMRFKNQQVYGGSMTERDISDLKQIARIYSQIAKNRLSAMVGNFDSSLSKTYGLPAGAGRTYVQPFIGDAAQTPKFEDDFSPARFQDIKTGEIFEIPRGSEDFKKAVKDKLLKRIK